MYFFISTLIWLGVELTVLITFFGVQGQDIKSFDADMGLNDSEKKCYLQYSYLESWARSGSISYSIGGYYGILI